MIQHVYYIFCFVIKIQWFQAVLNRCRLLNHDGVIKGGQLICSSMEHMTQMWDPW
jgi:hypothetical protein